MQTASQTLEAQSKAWMPMFLEYSSARGSDAGSADADVDGEAAGEAAPADATSDIVQLVKVCTLFLLPSIMRFCRKCA